MIRVTIFNEHVHEQLDTHTFAFTRNWFQNPGAKEFAAEQARKIRDAQDGGAIHDTLRKLIEEEDGLCVRHIGTLETEECGLTKEVLADTDVLLWWSHIAQEQVPDEIAFRVREAVWKGMGILFLHSAHMSKPMQLLLGTSGTLRWREGDFCRLWTCSPAHPIAAGIPEYVELEEEMYGEPFDIPQPEEQVFVSWYSGGEVFRSGCTWRRGYGKIFYFQPGHETGRSYQNPYIRQIIRNGIRWAAPAIRRESIDCVHAVHAPNENRQ